MCHQKLHQQKIKGYTRYQSFITIKKRILIPVLKVLNYAPMVNGTNTVIRIEATKEVTGFNDILQKNVKPVQTGIYAPKAKQTGEQ
ncbi:hypothetical protein ES705_15036 [subsurface metagenome]